MKLTELIDYETEKRRIDQMKQVAKQQSDRIKSAQALLKIQKAKEKEKKARRKLIQTQRVVSDHSAA